MLSCMCFALACVILFAAGEIGTPTFSQSSGQGFRKKEEGLRVICAHQQRVHCPRPMTVPTERRQETACVLSQDSQTSPHDTFGLAVFSLAALPLEENMCDLGALPADTITVLLSYCSAQDVCHVCCTSHAMKVRRDWCA